MVRQYAYVHETTEDFIVLRNDYIHLGRNYTVLDRHTIQNKHIYIVLHDINPKITNISLFAWANFLFDFCSSDLLKKPQATCRESLKHTLCLRFARTGSCELQAIILSNVLSHKLVKIFIKTLSKIVTKPCLVGTSNRTTTIINQAPQTQQCQNPQPINPIGS